MLRADSYPPDIWEAICTPMHEILPAGSARPGAGALFLGSWTAAVDSELLARHRVRAIVECLDAPWGICESGPTPGTSTGVGSSGGAAAMSHTHSSPVGGALAAHTANGQPNFMRSPTVPTMPPGSGRPPLSRALTSAAIPTLSQQNSAQSSHSGQVGRFKVAIADSAAPDILTPHLDGAVRFINERISRGENVLVHCQQVRLLLYIISLV